MPLHLPNLTNLTNLEQYPYPISSTATHHHLASPRQSTSQHNSSQQHISLSLLIPPAHTLNLNQSRTPPLTTILNRHSPPPHFTLPPSCLLAYLLTYLHTHTTAANILIMHHSHCSRPMPLHFPNLRQHYYPQPPLTKLLTYLLTYTTAANNIIIVTPLTLSALRDQHPLTP